MPLPKPHKGETQSDFMARCMHEAYSSDAPADRTQEQAVAMCFGAWRAEHGGKPPDKSLDGIAPVPGESHDDWMTRCQAHLAAHGRTGTDATSHCEMIFAQSASGPLIVGPKRFKPKQNVPKLKQSIDPDELAEPMIPDEEMDDFVSRCTSEYMAENPDAIEDDVEEACEERWDDYAGQEEDKAARTKVGTTTFKTHAGIVQGMEFILSDETPDRMGDIISADGWQIDNFKRNPIALFNHQANFPIGRWRNLSVKDKALRGHLEMAPEGISARIDEIRKLIDAGILRAVSVGFHSIEDEPLDKKDPFWGGKRYLKQELVETSLVSVPANPNALAVAKSLHISDSTLKMVFAKHGDKEIVPKRIAVTGGHAETSRERRRKAMSLSQRIQDSQGHLNTLRDQLTEHLKEVDDTNVSDAQLEVTTELNAKIAQAEKGLAALTEAEQRLLNTAARASEEAVHEIRMPVRAIAPPSPRPFTIPVKKLEPGDYAWRALTCLMKHHTTKGARPMRDVLVETYGDDEGTAAILNAITRSPAASAPATTTTPTWAQELVAVVMGDFYKALIPLAVFPKLSVKGSTFTFGQAGIITLPMRSTTPTISGSFVGEGAPIPVRQGAFSTQQMTPKKMAVITTFTREIAEHSTPSIEGIIRDAVLDDTSVAIDTVLLDNNAATAIRPAGLLNGQAPITATTGGGLAAVLGDVKALTNALITATRGNFRSPCWIMSPALAVSLSLTPTTGAQALPFRDEVARGFLMGIPIITSTTVTMGTLILVDAADFASVTGDAPRFEVSDQAVLHMEDTTPLAIGTPGSPATVAAPARSLWQTDTIGLRMILPMNWVMRRPTSVVWTQAVTWQ